MMHHCWILTIWLCFSVFAIVEGDQSASTIRGSNGGRALAAIEGQADPLTENILVAATTRKSKTPKPTSALTPKPTQPARTPKPAPAPTPKPTRRAPTPKPTRPAPTPKPTGAQGPPEFIGSATFEFFGHSVALSSDGNVLAVGAPSYSKDGVMERGLVRVFRFSGGSWSSTTDLIGNAAYDSFGYSVAISSDGNVLAVGAPNYNQDGLTNNGLVQVFRFSESSWSLTTEFFGIAALDSFGYSVTLSSDGNVLAVGAPFFDKDGVMNRGLVQVFRFSESSWSLTTEFFGIAALDSFGYSVALSSDGNVLAVGAPFFEKKGLVQVFRFSESTWSLTTDIFGVALANKFGWSVALSSDGNVLAVGAPSFNKDDVVVESGLVQVFRFSGGSWSTATEFFGKAFSNFGWSVALSPDGNVLAMGAVNYSQDGLTNTGLVQVFRFSGGSWSSPTDFIGMAGSNGFGWSVALSSGGNVLAMGDPYYDKDGVVDRGLVRVVSFT